MAMEDILDKNKDDWSGWAVYIVTTVKSLVEKTEEQARELVRIREEALKDLLKIKENIQRDMTKCQDNRDGNLRRAVNGIDKMINNLTESIEESIDGLRDRTKVLESIHPEFIISEKIGDLKENILSPMRMKITGLSLAMGAAGGFLAIILNSIFSKLFAAT